MPESTEKRVADAYDFDALRFTPQNSKADCLKTQKEIFLRRNLSDFLFLLLKKPRETVEYREFRDNVRAWTIYKDVAQVIRTIHTTKGELVKNLRLLRENFDSIEAVPAKGYRLSADVSGFSAPGGESNTVSEKADTSFIETTETAFEGKVFGGHFGQAFFASAIYASLFVVAFFIEIAYQFDALKNPAFNLSAPIFCGFYSLPRRVYFCVGSWRANQLFPVSLRRREFFCRQRFCFTSSSARFSRRIRLRRRHFKPFRRMPLISKAFFIFLVWEFFSSCCLRNV